MGAALRALLCGLLVVAQAAGAAPASSLTLRWVTPERWETDIVRLPGPPGARATITPAYREQCEQAMAELRFRIPGALRARLLALGVQRGGADLLDLEPQAQRATPQGPGGVFAVRWRHAGAAAAADWSETYSIAAQAGERPLDVAERLVTLIVADLQAAGRIPTPPKPPVSAPVPPPPPGDDAP